MSTTTQARPATKAKPRKTSQQVKSLPVTEMHVSKLNMRHGSKAPNIDDIYPSILEKGVNQSLLVRKEGKGWGVVAGRRRLFALRKKAKDTDKPVSAPCLIMESGNVKAAREASLLENIARVPASQIEQFAAFKTLADCGKTPSDIAVTFGLTELAVRRVLALANLAPEILTLFETEGIHWPTVQALTLATPDQQAAWLEIYHSDEYAPQGEQLKAWLTGGARIKTDTALFELGDYEGTIITDLFGETSYFQDPDLFWEHQNRAIAAAISEWKAQGWNEITVLERGGQFCAWEHGKRTRDQGGKIFVATGHDGSVTPHIGYLSNGDIKKIDAILKVGGEADDKASIAKPEMSGPLADYIALHRHSAIRASLLDHPSVALRLTVAHMLVGSDLWTVEPQKITSRKETTSISVTEAKGTRRQQAEREWMHDLLNVNAPGQSYSPAKKLAEGSLTELFAALLELDDDTVLRVMTVAMAESLKAGSEIVEALTYAIPVDMAALWEPDDAFFDILRDKAVINAMVKDVAGKACADGALTDTGKTQKQIIRNRMAGHGTNNPRPDWRPRWMQVPASHYVDQNTCPPAKAEQSVRKLMVKAMKAQAKAA